MDRMPITRGGFEKLKAELKDLKSVQRPKIVIEIEEAAAHGDLKENAEYHAAKERLGHIDGRMQFLEAHIAKAEIINPTDLKHEDAVRFGATVTILDTETDQEATYQIVGELESDIKAQKISIKSPIARGLIGKKVDDVALIKTPKGQKEFEITNIVYQ